MNRFLALACALLSSACASAPSAPPTATVGAVETPHVATAQPEVALPSGGHEAPHGGVVKMMAHDRVHLHMEVLVAPDGEVRLYPMAEKMKPIPVELVSGSITCQRADAQDRSSATLVADPADGSLRAKCAPLTAPSVTVSFDTKVQGEGFAGSVTVPPGGTAKMHPEHDHVH